MKDNCFFRTIKLLEISPTKQVFLSYLTLTICLRIFLHLNSLKTDLSTSQISQHNNLKKPSKITCNGRMYHKMKISTDI